MINNNEFIVILDQEIGDGSNLYTSYITNGLKENNHAILKINYNAHTNTFRLSYTRNDVHRVFTFHSNTNEEIIRLVQSFEPNHIFINELVSWQNPSSLTQSIQSLNIPYTIFVHDYFFICPSWNLIDYTGKYCKIPTDLKLCNKCLLNNTCSDHLIHYKDIYFDMAEWRERMLSFLQHADRIVSFSHSSKDILLKAYSNLNNICINEHSIPDTQYYKWKARKTIDKTRLNIGVLGHIGFHKGDNILKELNDHPDFHKMPVNILIFGSSRSFHSGYKSENNKISVAGEYKRENLALMIEEFDISAILIPSIWPETFSFTTSEALLLGYPVICFNIGASAERIKKYNSGIILESISTSALLNAFRKILDKPELIDELSHNTHSYVPPTTKEHLEILFKNKHIIND